MLSFALALVSAGVFALGLWRDGRTGEPTIPVDFSAATHASSRFTVWGGGTYKLFVSTVNHDARLVGVPLAAEFQVAVLDPDGKTVFNRLYGPGSLRHLTPQNYGDSDLATLSLDSSGLRRWTVDVRVVRPDPAFTARSQVKLWKQRYDPGMGGLMNYVMIIPAALFGLVALGAALALAASASRAPIIATSVAGAAFLALLVILR